MAKEPMFRTTCRTLVWGGLGLFAGGVICYLVAFWLIETAAMNTYQMALAVAEVGLFGIIVGFVAMPLGVLLYWIRRRSL